jgi:pilus assembly protein Flp/PilA
LWLTLAKQLAHYLRKPALRAARGLGEPNMMRIIGRFARSQSGATAVEYAVLCMCIVLVIILSVATLGTQLNGVYAEIPGYLK